MHPLHALTIGCALFATSIPSMANDDTSQDRRAQLAEHLRSADANADGYIDREEAEATLPRVARNFDRIDANQDDKLSFEEFKAAGERMGAMQRRRAR